MRFTFSSSPHVDRSTSCGLLGLRPSWLQPLADARLTLEQYIEATRHLQIKLKFKLRDNDEVNQGGDDLALWEKDSSRLELLANCEYPILKVGL